MLTRRGNLVVAGIALAVAVAAAVLVVALGISGGSGTSASGATAGETIFRSGRDPSGRLVPRSGGMMDGGMMGGGMMGGGCATCHGIDGRGRTTPVFAAPDIGYANLTDPRGMLEPDGSRGPTFSDATLKRAVIQGIDAEGEQLAWPMPQWQLTDQGWADLLSYLKTLP